MATNLFITSVLVLLTFHYTLAQLTFSTDWGKRSVRHNAPDCTPNPDTVIFLYKYLQNEFYKMIECGKTEGL
ncbi:adipokinetic hormone isoform X1 [Rhodnius prolixus]|uniref:Adipokinetic hormone prepropeptide n=1 Tax=Rhodnius prolixus TaxID=13249 RepID=T1H8R7_RHOPR|nr:adipokinetic hormone prepropeptide [Rhodnius prolixus]